MPEIAEVETVRRTLKERILRKQIKSVNVLYEKMIESDINEFKSNLIGLEFDDILRKGKWLLFSIGDYYLCSHLRMEGKYYNIRVVGDNIDKHEHVIFEFCDGTQLRYHDTRKFGRMNLVLKKDIDTVSGVKKQGIEPIDDSLSKIILDENNNLSNIIPIIHREGDTVFYDGRGQGNDGGYTLIKNENNEYIA